MNIETYKIEHDIEKKHWWFYGRRGLFKNIISSINLDLEKTYILDIGSSSGTNLRLLKDMGFKKYFGMDISPESKKFCEEKGLGEVLISDIQQYQLEKEKFDLVLLTDVLEHLEQDEAVIKNIYDSLKPGGMALITVPCFSFLWGPQDIVSQHLRRYKKNELSSVFKKNNFKIEKSFYFNFILFLPILIVRKILLLSDHIKNENALNCESLNFLLKIIFCFDCYLSQLINPPFGVSSLFLLRK